MVTRTLHVLFTTNHQQKVTTTANTRTSAATVLPAAANKNRLQVEMISVMQFNIWARGLSGHAVRDPRNWTVAGIAQSYIANKRCVDGRCAQNYVKLVEWQHVSRTRTSESKTLKFILNVRRQFGSKNLCNSSNKKNKLTPENKKKSVKI